MNKIWKYSELFHVSDFFHVFSNVKNNIYSNIYAIVKEKSIHCDISSSPIYCKIYDIM